MLSPETTEALSASATQIDLAMRASLAARENLGESIVRITRTVNALAPEPADGAPADMDLSVDSRVDWALLQLHRDLATAIDSQQVQDRVTQHLMQAQELLLQVLAAAGD